MSIGATASHTASTGSSQPLAQPGGAIASRLRRPADRDGGGATAQLDADVACCTQLWCLRNPGQRHEFLPRRTARGRRRATNRLVLHHPAAQQICIQSVGQCHRGQRYARTAALLDYLRFELSAVVAATPACSQSLLSVHVSTYFVWWTPSLAFLQTGSRCLHWALTLMRCLSTTNIIENPNGAVRRVTNRVSRWRDADMV